MIGAAIKYGIAGAAGGALALAARKIIVNHFHKSKELHEMMDEIKKENPGIDDKTAKKAAKELLRAESKAPGFISMLKSYVSSAKEKALSLVKEDEESPKVRAHMAAKVTKTELAAEKCKGKKKPKK